MTAVRRALAVVLGGVVILAVVQHRSELATAGATLSRLQWHWVAVAVLAEIASVVFFAGVQRWLLRAGGVDVDPAPMVGITLAANAIAMSVPGGAAWSATWAFGQLRRRGANRTLAAWVVLVAGALAGFSVFALVAVGSWSAGGRGPVAGLRWLAALLAAIPLVVALVYSTARRSPPFRRILGTKWEAAVDRSALVGRADRLVRRAAGNLRLVRPGARGWVEAFGLALANWLSDAVVLVAAMEALRVPIPWRGILVVYGLTQVSASLPVTPGGLGVVEGSMAALLIAYGVHAPAALATVLLYRIISFWGIVPVGWGAFLGFELAGRRAPRPSLALDIQQDVALRLEAARATANLTEPKIRPTDPDRVAQAA